MTQNTPHYSQPETIHVAADKVACDGGGGIAGHPKVYLPLDRDMAECPYCDRRYIRENSAPLSGH